MTALTRRGLIAGLGALLAAPTIVRASSLDPLSFRKFAPPATWYVRADSPSYVAYMGLAQLKQEGTPVYFDSVPPPMEGDGTLERPFSCLADAVARANQGDSILLMPGNHRVGGAGMNFVRHI